MRVRNRPGVAWAHLADDLAVEDEADLVRAADVEVAGDDLLEEDPAGDGLVEHLGEGELRLQDRQVVGVPGGDVLVGERVRQDRQPLAGQCLDVRRAEAVADRLQPAGVIDGGEPVIECLEADPGPGGLPLGPLVAVDAQLGGVGEVGAELEEERAEIGIDAIKIEMAGQRGGAHQPRVRAAVGVVAPLGPPHPRFLLRPADVQHSFPGPEVSQEPLGDVVLALLAEVHQFQAAGGDEVMDVRDERLRHRVHQRRGRKLVTAVPDEEAASPGAVLQPGLPDVEVHPVDALNLETHMIGKDISNSSR
jgi:hypothetical protein